MAERDIIPDPAVRSFQEQRNIVANPVSETVLSMFWSERARAKRAPHAGGLQFGHTARGGLGF